MRVDPLIPSNPERVRRVMREVAAAHPMDYVQGVRWEAALEKSLEVFRETAVNAEKPTADPHHLGF